jgi:hypothetical protein
MDSRPHNSQQGNQNLPRKPISCNSYTKNPDDWSNKGSQNKEKELKHNTPGYTKKKLTLMQTKVSF